MKVHTYGEIYTQKNIHTERTYIWKGHTHGGTYIQGGHTHGGKYIRRGHTHEGAHTWRDTYTKGYIYRGDIYM